MWFHQKEIDQCSRPLFVADYNHYLIGPQAPKYGDIMDNRANKLQLVNDLSFQVEDKSDIIDVLFPLVG